MIGLQCVDQFVSQRVLRSLPVKCIFLCIEAFNLLQCLFQAALHGLSFFLVASHLLQVSKCPKLLELLLVALQFCLEPLPPKLLRICSTSQNGKHYLPRVLFQSQVLRVIFSHCCAETLTLRASSFSLRLRVMMSWCSSRIGGILSIQRKVSTFSFISEWGTVVCSNRNSTLFVYNTH